MRYVSLDEVLEAHKQTLQQSGGAQGVRDLGAVESAVAQPLMSFGGEELYPPIVEKAAALGFSLIQNHPFVDGNKRTGLIVLATFLRINGYKVNATVDELETVIVQVASSALGRDEFTEWLRDHIAPLTV